MRDKSEERPPIPITKPFLPPKQEYQSYVDGIWEREWLTNDGPLLLELEERLKQRFSVSKVDFVSSGTMALQLAIRALKLDGEIITTPFSYVATSSSIIWEKCRPVYADTDYHSCNIDPESIEKCITKKTSAILATHVFGYPCDVESIQKIAEEHDLRVIYDAAHCFGTKYRGESIFRWGDISATSFHATKIFQTIEGGAVISDSEEISSAVRLMRNFGHDGPEKFTGVGINGKNSEFHAAMGLCNLKYIDDVLRVRSEQCKLYDRMLDTLPARRPRPLPGSEPNNSYYPLIFEHQEHMLSVKDALNKNGISPRRYFYPSLSRIGYTEEQPTPVADSIAKSVLCLPLYHDLPEKEQLRICEIAQQATFAKVN